MKQRFIILSVIVFLAAGVFFHFADKSWFPEFFQEFYDLPYFRGAAFVSALLVLVPRIIFQIPVGAPSPRAEHLKTARTDLQFWTAVALAINGLGELGLYQLYKVGLEFDKLAHLAAPFVLTVSISYFIYHWYGTGFKLALTTAALFVLVGSVGWEFTEFFLDQTFGTKTFGVYGKFIEKDTRMDILFDLTGIFAAGFALMAKNKKV